MKIKILIIVQTALTLFITSSLYIVMQRLNEIIEKKEARVFNDDDQVLEAGVIDDHYIVVLHDNATFIDGNRRQSYNNSIIILLN